MHALFIDSDELSLNVDPSSFYQWFIGIKESLFGNGLQWYTDNCEFVNLFRKFKEGVEQVADLPKQNELGFFEIRLESIGGLGANLAGKMLAEAGVVGSGFNGVSFSSYGSEKKGSPVKAHIRFCDMDTNIRDTTPVERPHIVGIFHENLSKTVNVISGIYEDSVVLVNSPKSPEELKEKLKLLGGTLAVVDATGISLEENNRVNMGMLGALFRLCDFLDFEAYERDYPQIPGEEISPSCRACAAYFPAGL